MKKNTVATVGALSMLVALLAAVLPVRVAAEAEPASAAVSATASGGAARENVRISGHLVLATSSATTWVAVPLPLADGTVAPSSWPTKDEADARAATWAVPAPGSTGPVSRSIYCLNAGLPGTRVFASSCTGAPEQQFRLAEVSRGWGLRSQASDSSFVAYDAATRTLVSRGAESAGGVQLDLLKLAGERSLSVENVTPGAVGEATVSGLATRGASVTVDGRAGIEEADADGRWTTTLRDLSRGGETITVRQTIDGLDRGSVEAVIPPWPGPDAPMATVVFDDDVHRNAVLHGTAEDGATIVIRAGDEIVAETRATAGAWSTELPPLGVGEHPVLVTQEIDGLVSPATTVPIDFGDAVSITSPDDGSDVPSDGRVDVTGRGEPGSIIELRDNGEVVATTTVGPDGTWSVPAVELEGR